ncbi:primase-helicase family protein [Dyadobacter bucti]|uniref:primase-helicase family protein n=1 Tax=Dyadobacter bucti TaxID=2572203 RepID=UPI003F728C65
MKARHEQDIATAITRTGYVRIGTSYYKLVDRPNLDGSFESKLSLWSVECIKADYGRDFVSEIPKLHGFCLFPDHFGFQQVVGKFYNLYHPFEHEAKAGKCKTCQEFVRHIFGDQYELGLDYLTLLLKNPLQKLPILCLVSRERSTGKTTFLNFLKSIFGRNMTVNTNEEFSSNFNDDWVSALIIAIDETFLERKQDSERIKNLSTALKYKSEAKGKDRNEVEFFGKFVLCSNNEDSFVFIEPGETRYWVRKIEPFAKENIRLLAELQSEIPAFLDFLLNRPLWSTNQSRMWFDVKQIQTPALKKLIKRNRSRVELELIEALQYVMDARDLSKLCFCTADALNWLATRGMRGIDSTQIKRVLQTEWGLKPSPNSNAYTRYTLLSDSSVFESQHRGRYYQIDQDQLDKLMI